MTQVVYSTIAKAELERLTNFIADQSGEARSAAVAARIDKSLHTLAVFPNGGRPSGDDGARRFSISPWVVIYRPLPTGGGIFVLRILDGRRDLLTIL